MSAPSYSAQAAWPAPTARGPLAATVALPGSKSLTNRELVLSALADGGSVLRRPLLARDTVLMVDALRALGAGITIDRDTIEVLPGPVRGGTTIDCGLAGTVMRFVPPVAALADRPVTFDGDARARARPMAATIGSLRALGVGVDDDDRGTLPFTTAGNGSVGGGSLVLDASQSSQFVSGLLLSAPKFDDGLDLAHRGDRLPSLPHIDMTVAALRARGVDVETDGARWRVAPGPIAGRDVVIEPDLSNAAPFLAAALVAGGSVTVLDWPARTTQIGDSLPGWLEAFGASVDRGAGLTVHGAGVAAGPLAAVDLDLHAGGELAPTLVGLAAFAAGTSRFTGIGHLRGHETNRLAALATELTAIGCSVVEDADGLTVTPGPLAATGRAWQVYGDHRMVTTGALIALAVEGLGIDDLDAATKTLPDFAGLWTAMMRR